MRPTERCCPPGRLPTWCPEVRPVPVQAAASTRALQGHARPVRVCGWSGPCGSGRPAAEGSGRPGSGSRASGQTGPWARRRRAEVDLTAQHSDPLDRRLRDLADAAGGHLQIVRRLIQGVVHRLQRGRLVPPQVGINRSRPAVRAVGARSWSRKWVLPTRRGANSASGPTGCAACKARQLAAMAGRRVTTSSKQGRRHCRALS